MKKLLLLFWIVVFSICICLPREVIGQDKSCSFTLKEAQRLYQQGLIKDIPSMLQGCLAKGFTRQERQDAYKLILLCLLYDDNQAGADSAMPKFLKKFPDYELNPTDPKEFVYLFNSYRNLPVLSVGLSFGANLTQVAVIESYQLANTNGTPRKYKSGGIGLQYGIQLNTYVAPQIEIGAGALIATYKFSSTDSVKFNLLSTQVIKAAETETRYEFPVFVRYNFKPLKKIKITPYARLGVVPAYTTTASVVLSRSFINKAVQNDVPAVSYDILAWRKQFGIWAVAGGGLRLDVPPYLYFRVDVKYQLGFSPMKVNADAKFADTDIGSKYYYRSDNFRLNNIGLSVEIGHSFYKPVKKQPKQ
jgi:hypothetical protein